MHVEFRSFSRPLKGRTRTATCTLSVALREQERVARQLSGARGAVRARAAARQQQLRAFTLPDDRWNSFSKAT
eukprot:4113545-Prymnesium_polylepis.1